MHGRLVLWHAISRQRRVAALDGNDANLGSLRLQISGEDVSVIARHKFVTCCGKQPYLFARDRLSLRRNSCFRRKAIRFQAIKFRLTSYLALGESLVNGDLCQIKRLDECAHDRPQSDTNARYASATFSQRF